MKTLKFLITAILSLLLILAVNMNTEAKSLLENDIQVVYLDTGQSMELAENNVIVNTETENYAARIVDDTGQESMENATTTETGYAYYEKSVIDQDRAQISGNDVITITKTDMIETTRAETDMKQQVVRSESNTDMTNDSMEITGNMYDDTGQLLASASTTTLNGNYATMNSEKASYPDKTELKSNKSRV